MLVNILRMREDGWLPSDQPYNLYPDLNSYIHHPKQIAGERAPDTLKEKMEHYHTEKWWKKKEEREMIDC